MGTKNNPGEFDCYEKAEPDEPMFVLLARDPTAPNHVRAWAHSRMMEDSNRDLHQIAEALDCADAMDKWYGENK